MPNKNIVDFANQVKSYAFGIKDQQVLGAWNELNNKATTSTISPATFTVNADKSVSVAVSSTPSGNVIFNLDDNATIKAGTRYLSGCPDIDSDDVFIQIYKSGVIDVKNKRGTEQEFTVASDITGATIRIVIGSGVSADKVDGKVFKPMISLEPNQPYVPYTMTNRELMNKQNELYYGIKIPSNSDLDNYKTTGRYLSEYSATTRSLSNVPTGLTQAFELRVWKIANAVVQEIEWVNFHPTVPSSEQTARKYQRIFHTSVGTWSSWFKFEGTVVS